MTGEMRGGALFVAYAAADALFVQGELLPALYSAGVRVRTSADFAPGANWISAAEEEIRGSAAVVVVVSAAFVEDASAEFLELLARTRDLEERQWSVIPLLLEEVALPPRLRMAVALDATSGETRGEAIRRLCSDFGERAPAMSPTLSSGSGADDRLLQSKIERLEAMAITTSTDVAVLKGDVAVIKANQVDQRDELRAMRAEFAQVRQLWQQGPPVSQASQANTWQIMLLVLLAVVTASAVMGAIYLGGMGGG